MEIVCRRNFDHPAWNHHALCSGAEVPRERKQSGSIHRIDRCSLDDVFSYLISNWRGYTWLKWVQ